LLCLIPSAGMLFAPETKPAGNERLAPIPKLLTEENAFNPAVLDEVTNYAADHFALRQQMVTLNAALYTRLFATSPAQDVIWGSDGWLYYAKTLPDYQNSATLSEEQARQVAQTVADMQAYCEGKGAKFLFTIAPNKNSLYPEYMPERYLQSGEKGNYERVEPYLRELSVNYADLFTFFSAQEEILYLKTDSHWSNRGAALVHDFLMQKLGQPHTGFAGMPYETAESHRGDLYEMLYPAGTASEAQQKYAFSFKHVTPPRSPEDILIRTTSEKGTGRLLFCRDSFGNALYPFLAEDFAEATVTRAMPYPLEQVQQGDVVIVEIVERNLGNLLKYPPALHGTK
ncbi:alginate O-acetyltransferase AlgX-related protein, partial [Agathobaculum sp.]|uniref:alginate O-acetyltransferase AlgX-related protein n=1 Tax=Agathobaculum sp. TaxID=2048138 RepID=UPI002A7F7DD7